MSPALSRSALARRRSVAAAETSETAPPSSDRKLRAKHVGKAGEKSAEVDALRREPAHRREDIGGATLGDDGRVSRGTRLPARGRAQCAQLGGDAAFAERDHLIGERERVAHRAVGGARDHGERVRFADDLFFAEYVFQARDDVRRCRCV